MTVIFASCDSQCPDLLREGDVKELHASKSIQELARRALLSTNTFGCVMLILWCGK